MCRGHPLEEVSGETSAKTCFEQPKGAEVLFVGSPLLVCMTVA